MPRLRLTATVHAQRFDWRAPWWIAVSLLAATVWLTITAAAAAVQTGRRAERSGAARFRTAWGHPDLQGRWTNATLTPLERPEELGGKEFFTEAEATEYSKIALERFLKQSNLVEEAAISGEFVEGIWAEERGIVPTRRTSLIVGPSGRLPPLTTEGQKRVQALAAFRLADSADSAQERPLNERCLWFSVEGPPMLPSIVYNSNYEIVQTPTHVVIHIEFGSGTRIIPLDGRPHLPGTIRPWFGDSRGRWEGDTLVVETTNFNGKRDLRGSTTGLRLVERFRRSGADSIHYEFTAEDPTTWTEPWRAEVPMRKLDGLIYEYACHEANYSIVNVLRGARARER